MRARYVCWMAFLSAATQSLAIGAGEIPFRSEELPIRLGVGYAVRLIDMNQDQRLDICVVDKQKIFWLENPTWKEHVLIEDASQTDNVCFAPQDIDGDGRLDFAVGADWTVNTRSGGFIQWIRQPGQSNTPWTRYRIGEEPTVHRMRFADLDGDGTGELIVLPLMGRNTTRPDFAEAGVRILSFKVPANPQQGPWPYEVIDDQLHVTHNFWPTDLNQDGRLDLLVVSFEGVSWLQRSAQGVWSRQLIGIGDQQSRPNRGASEIKDGRLADGSPYIATIEPWHGNQVVVYRPNAQLNQPWKRFVLDRNLKWGHAVWCVNLDDDPDQELVIGVRDNLNETHLRGVRIYDPQGASPETWGRQIVDPNGVAVEDLACADLDGDGRVDIVAVGRHTKNVRIYWNQLGKPAP